MSQVFYWPYDEVSIELIEGQTKVEIKTPWIAARVSYRAEDAPKLELLVHKIQTQTLTSDDIHLIHWLFEELDHFPFCYIVPAPKAAEASDTHTLVDGSLLTQSLPELLESSLRLIEGGSDLTPSDIESIVRNLGATDWAWDREAALQFAHLGESIHPESLFTVIRRYHLLDVSERDMGADHFRFIEGLEGEEFARAASLLVRQNHYVTQRCQDSLLPAVKNAGQAQSLVEDFVKAENGHDKILNVALKAMTDNPEAVAVSPETRGVMHLLKFAAQRNFLAFAMAVDFFERSSYEESDPLAQLLVKGGFDKAAKQINRHMEINDAGDHHNVACTFLASMAPCDPAYAAEAIRIAETVSRLMNRVTTSAAELFRTESP